MPQTNAIIVNLEDVPRLEANQRVNVTATLSLGTEKPKQVQLRTTQKTAFVNEDCIIEDSTGSAVLHIWEPMSEQLKSGTTYELKNLVVKHFQGTNHLSTSTSTSFSIADQQVKASKGPSLLECPERILEVKEFK
jgi:ssDNA-binding replication factor A large subunit